jgi:hypothetical protein
MSDLYVTQKSFDKAKMAIQKDLKIAPNDPGLTTKIN